MVTPSNWAGGHRSGLAAAEFRRRPGVRPRRRGLYSPLWRAAQHPSSLWLRPLRLTPLELLDRLTARYVWALLQARIYKVLPLLCPQCGGEMKLIAFITDGPAIREIPAHLGVSTSPPAHKPARGPPLWEMPGSEPDDIDLPAQRAPDYEFDQRIA